MKPPSAAPTRIADRHDRDAQSRRLLFENSAATALIAASMPPMPRPVITRQTRGRRAVVELVVEQAAIGVTSPPSTPVDCVTMNMPSAIDDEAAQDRRPPADLVGEAAQEHRAERHAQELRREHEAERRAVDVPFRGDAGRREADGENVEPVERVEADRDRYDGHLQRGHRLLGNDVARIVAAHRCPSPERNAV